MLNRFLMVLVVIPIAVILIALAVANRSMTAFTLDPFNPGNPAFTINAPIGMIIGSVATWFKQGRYRKIARQRTIEAEAARASVARSERAAHSNTPALPRP